ncbi:hypothetical protein [Zhihengliuella flava]|uniref:Uncharacterized protein n=1 Tax=Zhihengliuella flava TaxID=1285193 RepID=A0A931DEG1_9MICC|nr:hypothetical protein [Zhihengliuella flava]MBG6085320.1 hypothetical protein [Zhihengliuella flava]
MARRSLLIIVNEPVLDTAMGRVLEHAAEYVDTFGDLDIEHQELYAVSSVSRLRKTLRPPRPLNSHDPAATEYGPIHAIWDAGRWLTPGTCPAAPPDHRGATPWQWAHYRALQQGPSGGYVALWDLGVAEESAA